ncbi:Dps family protein [Kordiimonas aquimaris]|uniref:Dps family protein n=1 Tax=Kordiimonas aquimaris TaxID=707591 RepID=UPI0021D34CA1|nr:Dps family protein [Kordiimonas aquimaris]
MANEFNDATRTTIANALKPILAESVQLYVATQNVHWNVTGPLFQAVHTLTEEQYTELAPAIDEIAERIRTLGEKAPGTMTQYQSLGTIPEANENANAEDMVKSLKAGHNTIAERIRPLIAMAADATDDVTAGLLTDRLTVHEKAQWMLGAMVA